MIETFYSLNILDSSNALIVSLIIGIFFGIALEQAGFGSSRKLSGIFYFRDMTVLKVMFTAMITAMLGILYLQGLGIVPDNSIYLMPTIYKAQIIGGVIFGVGFVMSGWCPGTAAVGIASGKWDAFLCLAGVVAGSILFNETFPWIKDLYSSGDKGVLFIYDTLNISKEIFAFFLTLIALAAFWGSELIEKKNSGTGIYLNSQFLKIFSFAMIIIASGLFILSKPAGLIQTCNETQRPSAISYQSENDLLKNVENAEDHIDPEDLAEKIVSGGENIIVVDIRPGNEYAGFNIKNSVNLKLEELSEGLSPYKNKGTIVLYSNGMTHPAQARDSLFRQGFNNVFILTDGLNGFIDKCLKPVSLRSEPVPDYLRDKINQWRNFFLSKDGA